MSDGGSVASAAFQEWLAERYAPATRRTYAQVVGRFLTQYGASQSGWLVAVEQHVQALRDSGRSDATIDTALSALDAYGRWAGLGSSGIDRTGRPRPEPHPLTATESEHLRRRLQDSAAGSAAERAFVALLLETGVKVGEAVRVQVDDVDLVRGEVHVDGGRLMVRTVSVDGLTRRLLGEACAGRNSGPVFGFSARSAYRVVQRVAGCHPTALTDTYRTRLAELGPRATFNSRTGLHSHTSAGRYLWRRRTDTPAEQPRGSEGGS